MVRVKRCTRCGLEKTLDQFPRVRRGEPRLQSWCRACFAEVNAAYYARNREREKARIIRQTNARREANRRNVVAYLLAHPCVDCGETDIVVLEFDHRAAKLGDISTYANSGRSWPTIVKEIEKCDVRCANCHRKRTARSWTIARSATRIARPTRASEPLQLLLGSTLEPRTCRVCHVTKPLSEFPFRSLARQTRQRICLACQRDYAKRWYGRNRTRHIENAGRVSRAAKKRAASVVSEHLRSHPCVDCGETDIVVLEFDHIAQKVDDISTMVRDGRSLDAIRAEIAKCEVRCANCHRRRTVESMKGYRAIAELRPRTGTIRRPTAS